MVLPDGAAARMIDLKRERHADCELALLDHDVMDEHVGDLLVGVGHAGESALGAHAPGIADLAAGLGIERRLIENDRAALARLERGRLLAVAQERRYHALGALGLVAEEFRGADLLAQREPYRVGCRLARSRPGGACLLALALHGARKPVGIDADAARPQRILR